MIKQQKEWYKHGWGLVAAILLLPFFIIWYAWAKSNWSKNVKLLATGAVGLFIIIVVAVNGASNKQTTSTATTTQQPKTTSSTQTTVKETKPVYVYDIPALVGKNIDHVRSTLGQPLDKDPEPTKQQIELGGTEWYNGYKKDGAELTVTFDATTRKITDFFLSGSDKSKLMQQGNLQENQGSYRIEEVQALRGGGITGIKIIPQ